MHGCDVAFAVNGRYVFALLSQQALRAATSVQVNQSRTMSGQGIKGDKACNTAGVHVLYIPIGIGYQAEAVLNPTAITKLEVWGI